MGHLLFAAIALFFVVLAPRAALGHEHAHEHPLPDVAEPPPPPPPCEKDCYVLSSLSLRGAADGSMAFELRGVVRAREEQKVPLFGPPGQVRVDSVTLDGAPAVLGFDGDHYVLFSGPKSFVLRGRLRLGADQILAVAGPLVALDAHLTRGRLVEGDLLSGLSNTVLHFDPMTEGAEGSRAKAKVPPVFRLSRALRFGAETSFVYRVVTSQETDLGEVRLALRYGEKVAEVQGGASATFRVEDGMLVVPVTGHDADLTVTGTFAPSATTGPRAFTPDERAAYEWWVIESDPEHRIALGGEGRLVDSSQSPIPPTTPGARVVLLQRGQRLEVDAQSLVRGDVLAAAFRTNRRYVAVTGTGEVIDDETAVLDNRGLDNVLVSPSGKAVYVSIDSLPQRLLHPSPGSRELVVPVGTGTSRLRVQSLNDVRLTPFAGVITLRGASYPVATSAIDLTVGLPEHVRPIAVLGGDRTRLPFGTGDVVAPFVGLVAACLGFRTRRTRVLGALVLAGLWFVSREGFVFASAALAGIGAIFVATRFLRGTKLTLASGAVVLAAVVVGRIALSSAESTGETAMVEPSPALPSPEATHGGRVGNPDSASEARATPVSMSFPTSDRYVRTSRQLVTAERPFVPRIVFVTSTFVGLLHVGWMCLAALLAYAHKDALVALRDRIAKRLSRKPGVDPVVEALPPF